MAYQTFQQEYMQIPPITRAYSTACVLTTIAVQLDLVTPFRLYFNPTLIFKQLQFWRLVTNFMFFGTVGKVGPWDYGRYGAMGKCLLLLYHLPQSFIIVFSGFNFLFNMIFTYRYCRMLEENSFRGRTSDFFFMFLFGGTIMTFLAVFTNQVSESIWLGLPSTKGWIFI